jgi:sugar phosphate isomerase/epimerase
VVETHDGFSRGATLSELLQRVGPSRLGALWDVHHPYRMGEHVDETDRLIGDRVVHVHVKDATRSGDGWEYQLLGEGELPVLQAIRALERRGYDGYLSIDWEKMWHPELAGPEIVLPQYRTVLADYLAG